MRTHGVLAKGHCRSNATGWRALVVLLESGLTDVTHYPDPLVESWSPQVIHTSYLFDPCATHLHAAFAFLRDHFRLVRFQPSCEISCSSQVRTHPAAHHSITKVNLGWRTARFTHTPRLSLALGQQSHVKLRGL